MDNLKSALDSQDIQDTVDRDKQINQSMKNLLAPVAKCQITCGQARSKLIMHLQLDEVNSNRNGNKAAGNGR